MLMINSQKIDIKKFPNNESYIDLSLYFKQEKGINIFFKFEDDGEFLYLQLLKDYIDNNIQTPFVDLVMPYIPYSRMDRQENSRLFSLKTVAKMINNMNFNKVIVLEPHSDVSVALLDRVSIIDSTHKLTLIKLKELVNPFSYETAQEKGVYLIFPDAGAAKRYSKQFKSYKNIITCRKTRDFDSGRITNLELDFTGNKELVKTAIILDDLCSKGGTFLLTAKALKEQLNVEKIYLVVTHCENTIFDGDILSSTMINGILTTDSIIDIEKYNKYVEENKKSNLMIRPLNWGGEDLLNEKREIGKIINNHFTQSTNFEEK